MDNPQQPSPALTPGLDTFVDTASIETIHGIINATIEKLQQWRNNSMLLSGDDNSLNNTWEEICVQVQGEYSMFWDDVYLPTIDGQLLEAFQQLPPVLQQILSYVLANEEVQPDGSILINTDVVVEELNALLLRKAADYSNYRIEKYLQRFGGMDDEDEDFDDEEEEDDSYTETDKDAN